MEIGALIRPIERMNRKKTYIHYVKIRQKMKRKKTRMHTEERRLRDL